jgi:hypothetical protein
MEQHTAPGAVVLEPFNGLGLAADRGREARADVPRDRDLARLRRRALEQADAQAEVRDILLIGKAAQTNWKAAAWRLERRFPDRWGPKRPVEARPETSAEEAAARIRDALRAMRDSVEGPPGGSAADAS